MKLPDQEKRKNITLTGYEFNGKPLKGATAVIRYEDDKYGI
jgi:hypothetical protein